MKKYRYIYYLTIASCLAYLLSLSWLKWGDIIIDTFTWNFYVPLRVMNGAVLYKDIYNNVGFLHPYLLAFLFKHFGFNNYVVIYVGIVITFAVSFMLYKLSRFFLNRLFSTMVSVNFLFIFAFNNNIMTGLFNFIIPHHSNSTLFFMFILSALLSFMFFLYSDKTKYLILWSFAIWFAFLCRIEITATIWLGFILLALCRQYKIRPFNRSSLLFVLPVVMALLSYGIFLYLNDAFTGFKSGIIDLIMTNIKSEGAFAKLSAGYNDIFHSITDILISSIFQIFALYVFMTLANKIEKYSDSNKQSGIRRIVLTIVVLVYTAVIGQLLLITIASIQFKFIAIIFIGSIIAYFYRFIKSESYDKRYLMLLTVCLIPFILTGRIILDYTPIHYGFYLLPLGLVCYYMFYFNSFPAIYAKLLKTGETRHRYYYISAAILLVLLSLPYCYINHISFKLRDLKLNTNLGQFIFYDNEMLNHVIGLVQYLQKNTPRQSTLVVFPEGVSINLLANRNNPLKYFTFLPPEFKSIGESTIISSLIKEKIDYIAVVNLSTEEYGYTNFQSYATQLYKSIVENYTLDTVIAAPLHTKNNVNIVSSDFHDVEMLDKALRENYKLDECTITLFKHR